MFSTGSDVGGCKSLLFPEIYIKYFDELDNHLLKETNFRFIEIKSLLN